MVKLAFIGTHGVGKTTLCFDLGAVLKKRGLHVDLVKEVARLSPLPINRKTSLEAQMWILTTQIAEEIRSAAHHEVVVCDRSVLDNYAYLVFARAGRVARAARQPLDEELRPALQGADRRAGRRPTASATPTSSSCSRSTGSSTSCSRRARLPHSGCRRAGAASGRSWRPKSAAATRPAPSACSDADALESRLPPDKLLETRMADDTKPYVPPEENLAELTVKAVVLGVLVAALLGAANAYLGFKAGQTVSATFPAAVLAIAAFRLPFFRGTVLEQNTMRTAASVGEALVAGAIFTIPAFVMVNVDGQRLWTSFNYWETSLILLVGGVLGILFIVLLRRTLCVDAGLPFPESRACAEIVKAGQRGDTGARYVFGAMGLGMLIQVLQGRRPASASSARQSTSSRSSRPRSIHHFDSNRAPLGDVTHQGAHRARRRPRSRPRSSASATSSASSSRAINFAGGVLAWLVLVPLALFLNPELAGAAVLGLGRAADRRAGLLGSGTTDPADRGRRDAGRRRGRCGGCALRSRRRSAAPSTRAARPRSCGTERDLPARGVLLGIAALSRPGALIYYHFSQSVVGAVVAAAVMMVTGFLFSAVGGYLVGLVGGSNQPVSGLALSTLILAALLMVGFGVTGLQGVGGGARRRRGRLLRVLRLGQPDPGPQGRPAPRRHAVEDGDGRDPRRRSSTAFVLVFPIVILHEGNIAHGRHRHRRPQRCRRRRPGLMAQMAQGIVGGEMPWALILFGMALAVALILMKAPSPMLVAVGMYLPPETTGAIFVGGCLKALADWRAQRAAARDGEATQLREHRLARGLGPDRRRVADRRDARRARAGLPRASRSIGQAARPPELAWVDGPLGAWASLVPLAALVWLLVRVPLQHAQQRSS